VFNPGELPLVLLALADRASLTAYELIAELKRLLPGYEPSPGGIYPALSALVAEGLLLAVVDGRARRYELTDVGSDALERRRPALAAIETRLGACVTAEGSLDEVLRRFVARLSQVSGRVRVEDVEPILERAARSVERLVEEDQ